MKYVIRAVPILVALALFVSLVAIQQAKPVSAVSGTVSIFDSLGASVDFGTVGTVLTANVVDTDLAAAPSLTVKLTSDADGDTYPALTLPAIGGGEFEVDFVLVAAEDGSDDTAVPVELAVEDGDEVKITYTDADPGIDLSDAITADLEGPDFDNLTPEDGTIDDDETQTLSVEVTDIPAGVVEDSIMFLLADAQKTDDETASLDPLITLLAASTEDIEDADGDVIGFTATVSIGIVNTTKFIGAMATDVAGNTTLFDVDGDKIDEALSKLTVDSIDPVLDMALTGLAFDEESEDCDDAVCDLKENQRDWIAAVFTDNLTDLDGSSVDDEDFLVDGETPKSVKWFDEDGEVDNEATTEGPWDIRKLVFIQLDDELAADATPEVNLTALAGGIQDEASNVNNSDQAEAEDRIGPKFEIEDFDPPPSSASLVGDEVEVTFTITADEETDKKPTVTVFDVLACCDPADALDPTVDEVGTTNTKWDVTIEEIPSGTAALFNVHVSGEDLDKNESDKGIENVSDKTALTSGTFEPEDGEEVDCTTSDPCIVDTPTQADGAIDGVDCPCAVANDDVVDGFFDEEGKMEEINEDAIYFEGDNADLGAPVPFPEDGDSIDIRSPFFVSLDFSAEGDEFPEDDHGDVDLLSATLDDDDVCIISGEELCDAAGDTMRAFTSDGEEWLIIIENIELGEHELVINASDQAGNDLTDGEFKLEFEITERAAVEVELRPGWNLISLPGNPSDPSVEAVMASSPGVTIVVTYDPTIPGGFLVAQRDDADDDFSGNLTTMSAARGYWVLTNALDPIVVDVPPLSTGAGVLPPTVPVAKGWNLLPVQDPTGEFSSGTALRAGEYYTSAGDVSAVYEFDAILAAWLFVDITDDTIGCDAKDFTKDEFLGATVVVGRSYWVFSTEAGTLVPVPISTDITGVEHTLCDDLIGPPDR